MADFGRRGSKVAVEVSSAEHTATRTYAGLLGDVKSVAHELRHRFGFGEGDRALLVSPNDADYFCAVHATLQLGGALSPANPLYSSHEIGLQLRDSGAKVLIAHPAVLKVAMEVIREHSSPVQLIVLGGQVPPGAPPGTECFDSLKDTGKSVDAVQPRTANTLAVLPYSSGTTGLPKGTMLTHGNLIANVLQFEWPETRFWEPANEVLMSPLPFFHIYGFTASLNVCLWNGSSLYTLPAFDFAHFLGMIEAHKCTRAHLVPPIILNMAKSPLVDNYDLSSLRAIVSGAAPLSPEVEQEIKDRLGGHLVVKQAWGMSELSPIGTCNPDDKPKSGTSGPPVPGMEYVIRDPQSGASLGPGEEGEVVCRGPNVMVGYLNNPEGTAQCLDSDGWLRTGDVGFVDEDGYVTFTDRIKELIKYKGFQVPPAELEALLLTHPAVLDAAVIARAHTEAGEVPRAFVVLKPGNDDVNGEDLAAWAAERSAPHKKLRGGVLFLDQIPKSASGKILRRLLKDRDQGGGVRLKG
eukprot:CAMPEP_0118978490 /NCGR_PEP_ID=MMETSP1173-20130426/23810_1 /TAXON_ID=1034831 /ORGANISM="Rhizochromulina marina cf, Strain CCMP1243" /LENGTH=521 /DNA_ID=CAMNT_0006928687 /DNA_START=103 /DNA_END=1663 /DNA_ORIENTATION=-